MIIQLPQRPFSEKEGLTLISVLDKINNEFDFKNDDEFKKLSIEEQYMYIGFIEGANSILELVTQVDNPEINKVIEKLFSE